MAAHLVLADSVVEEWCVVARRSARGGDFYYDELLLGFLGETEMGQRLVIGISQNACTMSWERRKARLPSFGQSLHERGRKKQMFSLWKWSIIFRSTSSQHDGAVCFVYHAQRFQV